MSTRIRNGFQTTGNSRITGSLRVTAGVTASFTGSYTGDGTGLYNIPAAGIVGLNLSQISSGSVSASISPDSGLQVNTNVTATSFTGSLSGSALSATSASYAVTASYVLQAVSSSYALTASYVDGGGNGTVFPYTGSAIISGSLTVTGSIYTNSPIYSPFIIGLNFETNTPYTFNAPYSFYISSSESNPSGSITIKYQASGSATTSSYIYGDTINKFDSLIITPPLISLVILNSVRI